MFAESTLVAAGALVLCGLGCLAMDGIDIAKGGRHNSFGEAQASTTVNATADMVLLLAMIRRADMYCDLARQLMGADAVNPWNSDLTELKRKAGSPIFIALAFVEFFKVLAGFEQPYEGHSLQDSSEQLTALYERLALALPDDRWTGKSAEIYTSQIVLLRSLVDDLASKDKHLESGHKHVFGSAKDQADIVLHTRLGLGVLEGLLLVAAAIEWVHYLDLEPEKAWNWACQAGAAGGVALTCILSALPGVMSAFSSAAAMNASSTYKSIAGTRVLGPAPVPAVARSVQAGVAAAPETTITGFEAIVASMSTLSVPNGVPIPPASTMPTPVEIAAVSEQPAQHLTYADLHQANRTPEAAQRSAPMAQPGWRPGTPAQRPAAEKGVFAQTALAGELDGTEADVGIWAIERAPVDVATVGPRQGDSPWQI